MATVLLIVALCVGAYMAWNIGANDVANAVGTMSGAITALTSSGADLTASRGIPPWILVLGGAGIVVGLATYGHRVIDQVGTKITRITPARGFAAQFATASTVLFCSRLGLPVSTTCVLVGSVIGIGFAQGHKAVDGKVIGQIFVSWIVTIPIAAVLGAGIFKLMAWVF